MRIDATEANCLPRRRGEEEEEAMLRTHPHPIPIRARPAEETRHS